jgi:hypothetical protein
MTMSCCDAFFNGAPGAGSWEDEADDDASLEHRAPPLCIGRRTWYWRGRWECCRIHDPATSRSTTPTSQPLTALFKRIASSNSHCPTPSRPACAKRPTRRCMAQSHHLSRARYASLVATDDPQCPKFVQGATTCSGSFGKESLSTSFQVQKIFNMQLRFKTVGGKEFTLDAAEDATVRQWST